MNRRTLLVLGAEALLVGCLADQPIGERNSPTEGNDSQGDESDPGSDRTGSPTPTDRSPTPTATWGDLSIGNVSVDPVTVTLTVEDVEGSSEPVRTYSDTVKLGPDDHEDHDHDHAEKSKTYTDLPVNHPGDMHRLTVAVDGGPTGSKRFRPANMDSDLSAKITRDEVEFRSVVGGPNAPATSTPTEQS